MNISGTNKFKSILPITKLLSSKRNVGTFFVYLWKLLPEKVLYV